MGKTIKAIKENPISTPGAAAERLRNIMQQREKSDSGEAKEEYKAESQSSENNQASSAEFDKYGRIKNRNFDREM